MTIRQAKRRRGALLAIYFGLAGMTLAQGLVDASNKAAATNVGDVLTAGSVQAVLAVCLLAVSGALVYVQRELNRAHHDRIAALETEVVRSADKARAEQALALAISGLQSHCREMAEKATLRG